MTKIPVPIYARNQWIHHYSSVSFGLFGGGAHQPDSQVILHPELHDAQDAFT